MSGFDRLTPTGPIVPVRRPAHPADQDRRPPARKPARDRQDPPGDSPGTDDETHRDTGPGRIDEYA